MGKMPPKKAYVLVLGIFLTNMFAALKGSLFYFYFLLLQLVLCCVAALKSLAVHHP